MVAHMGEKRSGLGVMASLIGLVRPLLPFMLLAITLGVLGFSAATLIPLLGGYGILRVLDGGAMTALFAAAGICALLRGALRYGEQLCNHYIAFKLLALIRTKVFDALRRLSPAKLEGRDKGNLISIITSDIELLEVFYAHTISPVFIAAIMTLLMSIFIGRFHFLLGLIALAAYVVVGVALPMRGSRRTKEHGAQVREQLGDLNSYVLESLHGMQESIQYGDGENRLKEMNRRGDALSEANESIKVGAGKNAALTNTVISTFSLLMLLATVMLNRRGLVDFEGTIIPVIALVSSFGPVAALSNLGAGLQQTIASGNRVLELMEEMPAVSEVSGELQLDFWRATLKCILVFIPVSGVFALFSLLFIREPLTAAQMAGRVMLIGVSSVPMVTLPPINLTRCMEKLGAPRILTLGMLVAIRFVPVIGDELRRVREAMRTRGVRASAYRAFIIPVMIRLVNISDTMALSLETRAFSTGGEPAGVYRTVRFRLRDGLYCAAVAAVLAGWVIAL